MVRVTDARDVITGKVKYFEFAGLSRDTKPTDKVSTGSLFLEVDTGDVYAYNEEGAPGSEWCKIASLGGGN